MPILGAGTAATALLVAAALYVADLSPAGRLAPATGHPAGRAAGPTAAGTAAELDIFAAVIRAGLNPAAACAAVADSSGHPRDGPWATAAVLAGMGVDPARAYAPLAANPRLEQLAAAAAGGSATGAAIAPVAERLAQQLRAEAGDAAVARAERAGVALAMPLALFFLPAFIVLGLVPVIADLVGQML